MPTILAFGYHDRESPRHETVCAALRKEGWSVVECHTGAAGFIGKYRDLAAKFRALAPTADAVLVTFPGHFLVPLAWKLTRSPRKKLLFDAFISLYDTDVLDRRRWPRWHPRAWLLWIVDRLSCRLADETIIDTEAHKRYFVDTFGLRPERVRVVYLETKKDVFTPRQSPPRNAAPEILFYGTLIPLQGVDVIGRAIGILAAQGFPGRFTFVGPEKLRRVVESWRLPAARCLPFAALPELAERLRGADLCLGIFGTSGKAERVIPHKVVDAVACGVPVITADTPAIRERFADHPLVRLVPAGSPEALARAIRAHFPESHAVPAV